MTEPDSPPQDGLSDQMGEPSRDALALAALQEILLPAARLMIANGVQLTAMVEALKQALVLEAMRTTAHERSSDTRISVLTGVHRKDVKRLSDQLFQSPKQPVETLVSIGSQVVGRWISDPRFLDADGAPLALARTPRYAADDSPSFSELVSAVSSDVGARAVLDELLRLDAVRESSATAVELRLSAFVPSQAARESLHFLAANVSDHLASAVYNQSPQATSAPLLEQSAFSTGLTLEQASRLQQLARAWWAKALKEFLREANDAQAVSSPAAQVRYRVRFGAYFYLAQQDVLVPKK